MPPPWSVCIKTVRTEPITFPERAAWRMVCSFRCDPCSLYLKRGAYPCTLWATAVVLALTPGTQSGTVPLEHPPVCTAVRGLTLSPQAQQLSVAVAGAEAVQVVDLTSQRAAGGSSRQGCHL